MKLDALSAQTLENTSRSRIISTSPATWRTPVSEPVVCGLMAAADVVTIFTTGIATAWASGLTFEASRHFIGPIALLGTLLTMQIWQHTSAYCFATVWCRKHCLGSLATGLAGMMVAQLALVFVFDAFNGQVGTWFLLWFASSLCLLFTTRLCVRAYLLRWNQTGRLAERVAIVGATTIARQLASRLRSDPSEAPGSIKANLIGIFDDADRPSVEGTRPAEMAIGSVEHLLTLIKGNYVDTVIIAVPLAEAQRITRLLDRLQQVAVDIRLCPDQFGLSFGRFKINQLGRYSLLGVAERPLCHWRRVKKNLEDWILGTAIFTLILPLMVVIAVLIKWDSPGPILFRQKRIGFNNRPFEVLKFRTMHHSMQDANADRLTTRNDPRVTRLGAFLRRTSLDELPQFINVLRGDMSIVGPRPHAPAAKAGPLPYHEAVRTYYTRHRMKPGITGWAQVNGWRGETQTTEQITRRVEHDLFYVENWSLAMDIKIILRTIFGGFTGKSAY